MSEGENAAVPPGPAPIEPAVPLAAQQDLLERLPGTRVRDLEAVEAAHRALLAASPELHGRLLRWLTVHEPESPHLAVGLAVLATGADPGKRCLAALLVERLPLATVAAAVDYI